MNLLIDTHVFLWMLDDEQRLTTVARDALLASDNELYLSMASYWEICIKLSIGKLSLQTNWPRVFEREMRNNSIQWLAIKPEHARITIKLPWLHRDPFDRLIVAQCRFEHLTLATADPLVQQYDIPILW